GVGRGEDYERRLTQVLDRVSDPVVGRKPPDLDGGNLDHRRAEVHELPPERVDLVARAGDEDAPAMQGTPGERVQALGHGHARAKDEEGVTAKPVRGRL